MGIVQFRSAEEKKTGRPNFDAILLAVHSPGLLVSEVVVVLGLNGDRRLGHGGLLLLDRIRGRQQRTFSRPGCRQRTPAFRPTNAGSGIAAIYLW
jgi:hypothetical protein